MNFVKVFQVGHGETVVNLDTVVQIERVNSFYRLYFNAVLVNDAGSCLYSTGIINDIGRMVKNIDELK